MTTSHLHWINSVHHDGSPRYVIAPMPSGLGSVVKLKLRTARDATITRIYLRTCPDGEQAMVEMKAVESDSVCQWWEASIVLSMPWFGYRFFLLTPEGGWWFNAMGMSRHNPTDNNDFKLLAGVDNLQWVREGVFYQIFPDRFADGDASNNVRSGEYLCYNKPVIARSWGELPHSHKGSGGVEFFGGDLIGIKEKLGYLTELGVSGIYLNPIFTAPSNHKYDTADYYNVDPHLGGNEALIALRQAMDEYGMRMVLDIVLNHCGVTHSWFTTAQADKHSPTADFFTFEKHPEKYACWLGISSLPKLNYRSHKLRELIYEHKDAILRRWLQPPYRIDGWRIDVANMLARQGEAQLGHKIGRGIRRAVKTEFPHSYLLGEHFHDGTPHLQGRELDASMNYRGFTFPLLQWLNGFDVNSAFDLPWADAASLPTTALVAQWQEFKAAIPWQIAIQQLNLVSSHDIPRILTIVGNDVARAQLAATLLFTYPGVPCIYYGDEIGLVGGKDPDNRRCMIWDSTQWNGNLYNHYQKLIKLRKQSTALCEGGFQLLHASDETLAFLRESLKERMVIVARRNDDGLKSLAVRQGGFADGTRLREFFTGSEVKVMDGLLPITTLSTVSTQIWQEI